MPTEAERILLAIDPGNDTGWSTWGIASGLLLDAGVVSPDDAIGRWMPDHLVMERPQVYLRSKADPDNIITLALTAGRYLERYRGVPATLFKPVEWKGNIDKDVMTKRIEDALTSQERAVTDRWRGPARLRHNMLDSIGLAKFLLRKWRLDQQLAAGPRAAA